MKILKSAVVAFSLTVAMGSFSTAAVAESDPGRVTHKPIDAVKGVQDLITAAETAMNNGASPADAAAAIKKAANFAEEINANDRVARENSKVAKHMKAAEKAAKAGSFDEAKGHLAGAKETLENLKKLI